VSVPEAQVFDVDPYGTKRYRHFSHRWDRATEAHPRNCLETPPELVERIRALLGSIDLDPCTRAENPVGAARFYTPADDGILQPWNAERIFFNPPFGRTIELWVEKAAIAAQDGAHVVGLVPAHTSSGWFQRTRRRAGSSA
jgi:phage N-6-adenine-methyltransferase